MTNWKKLCIRKHIRDFLEDAYKHKDLDRFRYFGDPHKYLFITIEQQYSE